jgi:flavin reductase (DIM6/NTAB) family NADH-FMN oxidoreductase RutF
MTSTNPPVDPPVDPVALRAAFGAFMTGVTVVTTHNSPGAPVGFTANSFTSVSLNPPLILVCIADSSQNIDVFRNADGYGVSILAESQEALSRRFAAPVDDRFEGVNWHAGPHGAPIIDDVSGWFDCRMHDQVQAGDHLIMIGEVKAFGATEERALGYARSGYFRLDV